MYLKEIKAHGFKSFADKTDIVFTNGINGIVGPNGSGKSNVVDAVRWVLGEQSVKSLRGDGSMTDVIFSGSKSRGAMNVASVSLIFDNTDKYLPIEYDEVEIKRRVYRDGTNEYFLNGGRVRLKDITSFLLDSGIAKESFNIISQGKIEEIISSKPLDRRSIFEEAAGVLKYKRRKEEALHKLDRTKDNKSRVGDILKETEERLNPLKEAKEKAETYTKTKSELENIEIALITEEITNINFEYQTNKGTIEKLKEELLKITSSNTLGEAKIEEYKVKITDIDTQINAFQNKLLELTALVQKLDGQKDLLAEKQKHEENKSELEETILTLKNEQLSLEASLDELDITISNLSNEIKKTNEKMEEENQKLQAEKDKKQTLEEKLTNLVRQRHNLNIREEYLKNSIENGGGLPEAVKRVLNNPRLEGIHGTVGNLIEVDENYNLAISSALGYTSNNIITSTDKDAKEALNFLKTIGRATFFPLNVIKPKTIDSNILNILKNENGFIDIASNLIKYDKIYTSVMLNQLGTVIITDNIDNAVRIGKKINHRYRIVTLDGDTVNIGGSMTGGKQSKPKNVISDKYELENVIKQIEKLDNSAKEIENQINETDYNLKSFEDKIYLLSKDKMLKNDALETNCTKQQSLKQEIAKIKQELQTNDNLKNGSLSKEREDILEKYYAAIKMKNEVSSTIDNLTKEKKELNEALEDYQISIKKENSIYSAKTSELKDLEIKSGRMDVKLDNLLNNLSENYHMTYEKAKETYKLEIDYDIAKERVRKLRKTIDSLGPVNLTAPEEYEEVSSRYEFLTKQLSDLDEAENTLHEIIKTMDKVMIQEFSETFTKINKNFEETFKELFKGGRATLKLTDPDNILETGVEIIASPPGKKLTSITLLSGGEKTLTAISLLFAIIKTKQSPFCILDEVEAALDEANVDTFGKYITKLKNRSQFIIITHKKKTMEYADILYGITMQESGVSKLVSVRLEDI